MAAEAWEIAVSSSPPSATAALLAAEPYCEALFDQELRDVAWRVAEESLGFLYIIENPSAELKRVAGWMCHWLSVRDRVRGQGESALEYAERAEELALESGSSALLDWARLQRLSAQPVEGFWEESLLKKCKDSDRYLKDMDYRAQVELRTEEFHIWLGETDEAVKVLQGLVAQPGIPANYKAEAFFILHRCWRGPGTDGTPWNGPVDPYREVPGVWALSGARALYPEAFGWSYSAESRLCNILPHLKGQELVNTFEVACASGPACATNCVRIELLRRLILQRDFGRAREVLAVLKEEPSPIPGFEAVEDRVEEAILRQEIQLALRESGPGAALKLATSLLDRHQGVRLRLAGWVRDLRRHDAPHVPSIGDFWIGWLDSWKSLLPHDIYWQERALATIWKGRYAETVEAAETVLDSAKDPRLRAEMYGLLLAAQISQNQPGAARGTMETLLNDLPDRGFVDLAMGMGSQEPHFWHVPRNRMQLLDLVITGSHSPSWVHWAYFQKGLLNQAEGNTGQAVAALEHLIAQEPCAEDSTTIPEGMVRLAAIYRSRGEPEKAEALYKRMIVEHDRFYRYRGRAFLELTSLLFSEDRLEEALAAAERGCEEVDPSYKSEGGLLWVLRAQVLIKMGKETTARTLLQEVLPRIHNPGVQQQIREMIS